MEQQLENQQRQNSTAIANTSEGNTEGVSLAPPVFQLSTGGSDDSGSTQTNSQTELATAVASQEAATETWDRHTNRRIAGIHPAVQSHAYTLVNRAESELGIKLRVTSGLRSFEEQDELYAQGRTAAGGVVTNARGGQSYHNYGLAIDVVEITDAGEANWNCDWNAIGALGQSIGWEWGGSWTSFVDKPHFQMAFGLSTTQLRGMYNAQGGNFVSLDGQVVPEIPEGGETTPTTGNPDGQTTIPSGTIAISESVGQGGQNIYDDVKVIQTMLNSNGASLVVDGDCGPLTIAAIKAYQMSQFGWQDGRVDVNGKTWNALEANTAPQPLVYSVVPGDNLTKIAQQFNTSVAEILSANPGIADPNSISIGQKITIPTQGGGTTTPVNDNTNDNAQDTGGQTNPNPDIEGTVNLIYGSKVSREFGEKVVLISQELGINPNYLMAAMAFETGGSFDPAQENYAGSGATGLIQFMPSTARGLGTTTAELAQMTAVEQLDYVKAYFEQFSGYETLEDLYMAILWPRGIGKSDDYVLWSRGSTAYRLNSGLDSNNDGTVTKAEAAGKVRERYDLGQDDIMVIGEGDNQSPETGGGETGGGETEGGEKGGTENDNDTGNGGVGAVPASSNFSISEFHCNDGTPVPEELYSNVQELMNNLEVLREELDGNSIRVNSGYRTPAYNESVGGATNSQHKLGKAADIVVTGYSPGLVHATIARLIREGKMKQGGLGRYNTFTHYDVRGSQARW